MHQFNESRVIYSQSYSRCLGQDVKQVLLFSKVFRGGIFFQGNLSVQSFRAPVHAGREVPQEQVNTFVGRL